MLPTHMQVEKTLADGHQTEQQSKIAEDETKELGERELRDKTDNLSDLIPSTSKQSLQPSASKQVHRLTNADTTPPTKILD